MRSGFLHEAEPPALDPADQPFSLERRFLFVADARELTFI
jgi:hypothetical protein